MNKQYYGTGRRKTSIARVFLQDGKGNIVVNSKPLDDYFSRETSRMLIRQPLVALEQLNKFDIHVQVRGGGSSSQAGATRLGIARAMLSYDESNQVVAIDNDSPSVTTARGTLRQLGLLTRDSRKVERKKVGKHKARKGTQYSKR